ncbi:MAG: DUF4097 family beta strand repeat-containing protein [Bacteroidota bacterium]
MKKIKAVHLFLFAIILSMGTAAQDNTKEQLVVPLSEPGKPFKLNVGLVDGSITVSSYDGKDIVIDGETENEKNNDRSESSGGMKRIYSHSLSITAEEKNNQVSVHTDKPNKSLNLSIKIPKGVTSLKLETVNDGDIEVNNISAEMEITNVNGGIKLTGVSGSVVANTVNGDVIVTFKSIDNKAPMAFTTLNGNVDVSFPATLQASVKLKSDNGGIYTDFEVAVDNTQPKTERTKEGNMYKVSVKDWVYGKIGGGGPEIMMKNMNGNIYARKAK